MTKFCTEEISKQNDSKISRTDQNSNTEIGVRLLFPILDRSYLIIHRFWCGNTLLEGDFKYTKKLPKFSGATGGHTTPFLLRKT